MELDCSVTIDLIAREKINLDENYSLIMKAKDLLARLKQCMFMKKPIKQMID
jgi:hypothetical protein